MTRRWIQIATLFVLVLCGFSSLGIAAEANIVVIPKDPTGGGYQSFPDVARLQDGRLMCTFYCGYWHISPANAQWPNGGRQDYSISSDEGYTWSTPKPLNDGPIDDLDPSVFQARGGRLFVNYFSETSVQPTTWETPGTSIITSDNAGKTWSAPQLIYPKYYTSSPIRELSDGRWIMGLYTLKGAQWNGAVGTSDDQGQTWNPAADIPLDSGSHQIDAETDVIQLKNGSLYAAERSDFDGMFFSRSTNRGGTWSASQSIGFSGHCPYFHRTPEGIILLGYRNYYGSTTSLRYSLDECNTWSNEVVIDTMGGAYPSIVDLRDGTELVVYYEDSTAPPGANIRVKRFRATMAGIEWLPVVSSPIPEPGTISLLLIAMIGLSVYTCGRRNRFLMGDLAMLLRA